MSLVSAAVALFVPIRLFAGNGKAQTTQRGYRQISESFATTAHMNQDFFLHGLL